MISCDGVDQGCTGGNIIFAMSYVAANALGGLATWEDFPYTDAGGVATETCPITSTDSLAVSINDPRIVMSYDDEYTTSERLQRLKYAVARQPVSVALKALCPTLSNYRGGILTKDIGCSCEETSCIDHAVLMVGYDDTDPVPHWILKNQWGTEWGEDGYFRVAQDTDGAAWGLFGLLGEAVVTLEATTNGTIPPNMTGPPAAASLSEITWWQALLFGFASLVAI